MEEIDKSKCPNQNCGTAKIFAYLSIIYIIACFLYLVMTKNIGTPFKDAIKLYPNLLAIKSNSASTRSNIFYIGLTTAFILILIIRPFN